MKPASLRPFLPLPALRRRILYKRSYAIQSPIPPTLQVFDTKVKQIHRELAASNPEASRRVDYLRDEVASRLCDRLLVRTLSTLPPLPPLRDAVNANTPATKDINRHFPTVLDLGSNACNIARALTNPPPTPTDPPLHSRLTHLTSADWSPTLLHRDSHLPYNTLLPSHTRQLIQNPDHLPLPFPPASFSAILSSLSLHWINDLPSLLAQISTALQPDSPFLFALLGGDSLYELRTSLQLTDLDRLGGVSTHVSPLADVRDVGGLLQKAGFKLLTVDVDDIVVEYPDAYALMRDLQDMGEGNASLVRETTRGLRGLGRDVLVGVDGVYREMYGSRESVPATWRVIFGIGWTGGEGQPEPLRRGSGEINMKDVLEGEGGGGGGKG
ncbi:MAG: hypothetical protein Q9220_007748 [cf. Caloplaca sp. 1 TL-2023]